jgi:hypothetical protein
MRALAGILGALLVALMLSEFFVTFLLPRRVRRDPRIGRGLSRALWRPWRALAWQLRPRAADTFLGFFGPFALIFTLLVWAFGLVIGYGLIEWAVSGRSFSLVFLVSSGLFLSAEPSTGSTGLRVVELLEAATGVGVLFIVIGYMPSIYTAFSRRETAVSQLATRGGSPPAAAVLLRRAAGRNHWRELERDLSYPLLAYYRSQHVNQNWLAALTAMVVTAWEEWAAELMAFVKATVPDDAIQSADLTYRIGRHAFSDLALQFNLEPVEVDRLSDADFGELFDVVDRSAVTNVDRETARRRLDHLRREYEPKAQALAEFLVLEVPAWR